ncbi:tRNA threonylcarbamoyladenosine dehydratase [Alkaliflexus imshenetskii]|uniref:tRNA threonylcarbamoyladenosine dehydratase n=1 Tax=Alkaliflexus imshenetskii TaxID=286730 RepID=UPI00047CAD77|nr:tRNA threonylcarbamoyladenosine dehydratase [Alkaliflexus imshenetskii]
MDWLERTDLLVGSQGLEKLQKAHVLVAGMGGVGSWAAEMLVRAGVGEITLVDGDDVKPSNRNRQLPALSSTQFKAKVEVMANRLLDINPELVLHPINCFITEQEIIELLQTPYDYVLDAIDSLTPKVLLIAYTLQKGTPVISSMGAGGKLDPALVQVADISKSYNCKLARMVRKRLNKFDIKSGFQVVFSPEMVQKEHLLFVDDEPNKKTTVGTISYMPALFGIIAASTIVRSILSK